jgi:hypothetical protein
MDDLLAVFGLGRAITLASALIVSVGALSTVPVPAVPPPRPVRLAAVKAVPPAALTQLPSARLQGRPEASRK